MKLSKPQFKKHAEALALCRRGIKLTDDEKIFVLENYHPGATHINSAAGAFFTPMGLARDFSIEVGVNENSSVIDLCAGIGGLTYAIRGACSDLTCVEINPEYVEVGRMVVPEAKWICASVFDIEAYRREKKYTVAISNPPFGNIARDMTVATKYLGSAFDLLVVDLASQVAKSGVFILPSGSVPFVLSGPEPFRRSGSTLYSKFHSETGIDLEPSCGIDTTQYSDDWLGVKPSVEIATAEFSATVSAYQVPATIEEVIKEDELADVDTSEDVVFENSELQAEYREAALAVEAPQAAFAF